jgi:ADP-ribose pyrophosphatase
MVDLGERMREAAAREVREECGIEIEVGPVVEVFDNIVPDDEGRVRFHYTIIDLAARYVSGDLVPNEELMDAAWITLEQFETYGVRPKTQAVLRKALRVQRGE